MCFSRYLVVIIVFADISVCAGPRQSVEVLLLRTFSGADSIHSRQLSVVDTMRSAIEKSGNGLFRDTTVTCYEIFNHRQMIGFGFAASVQSRSSKLNLLLCIDTTGSIVDLELSAVSDQRIARLRSPVWKRQFFGKSEKTLGQIDAVSGATISSNDITGKVKNLLVFLRMTGILNGNK